MEISEHDLRTMIREAIARHAGGNPLLESPMSPPAHSGGALRAHASHALLAVVSDGDGECIIEPSVRCDHCGYCKSLGH